MAHFFVYVRVLVPDVVEARFSEPVQEFDTDVVAVHFSEFFPELVPGVPEVHFSESVQEPDIDVVLVPLVLAWPVRAPVGAAPADDQLLEGAVHPDCFGSP